MNVILVGVDCSAIEAKIGLALAEYQPNRVSIRDATLCDREHPAAETIAKWVDGAAGQALLAIDAPLGWPEPLARTLARHQAGEKVAASPNDMFRRATDRFIQKELSKKPLDVGADRIARTAHAGLRLLGDLRCRLGLTIPLGWSSNFSGLVAIEVYPAATLVAHGIGAGGYKKAGDVAQRREVVTSVSAMLDVGVHSTFLESSADALDALVCVLAAKDFLEERAMPPANLLLAKQEGWIWAARRQNGLKPDTDCSRQSHGK